MGERSLAAPNGYGSPPPRGVVGVVLLLLLWLCGGGGGGSSSSSRSRSRSSSSSSSSSSCCCCCWNTNNCTHPTFSSPLEQRLWVEEFILALKVPSISMEGGIFEFKSKLSQLKLYKPHGRGAHGRAKAQVGPFHHRSSTHPCEASQVLTQVRDWQSEIFVADLEWWRCGGRMADNWDLL